MDTGYGYSLITVNNELTTALTCWTLVCFKSSAIRYTLHEQKPRMEPLSGRTNKTYVPTPCTWIPFGTSNLARDETSAPKDASYEDRGSGHRSV